MRVADPGVGAPFVLDNAHFLSLREMYKFLSCAFLRRRKPDGVARVEAALSQTSPRRHGLLGLGDYVVHLVKNLATLEEFYMTATRAAEKEWALTKKRIMLGQILAHVAPNPQDLVVIGGNFDGCRAWAGCPYGTPTLKSILEYLERHRMVLYIDEFYTSQKCFKCTGQLVKQSAREKMCPSADCNKRVVNRDLNASANLCLVFTSWLKGEPRPEHLRRPQRPASAVSTAGGTGGTKVPTRSPARANLKA